MLGSKDADDFSCSRPVEERSRTAYRDAALSSPHYVQVLKFPKRVAGRVWIGTF